MSDKVLYWSSVIFSAMAFLLLITNTTFINGNRQLQEEVNVRQNTISRAVSLTQLNQNLAQALANFVVTKNDKEIGELLTSQGITVRKTETAKGKPAVEAPAKQ